MRLVWGLVAAAAISGQVQAAPACPAGQVAPPPAGFARWGDARPIAAATTPATAQGLAVPLNAALEVSLAPVSAVQYAAPPAREDDETSKAGMIAFDVASAGTYRVALGTGAWIEVVRGGRPMLSTGHGHGPDCSSIRKIVDFRLSPGRYVLQISDSDTATVTAMIAAAAMPAAKE